MKKNLLLLTLVAVFAIQQATAQTNHSITTVGTSFSPDNITIAIGDTITWTNGGGTHNVNGTTAAFSGNPESFSSGAASTGWTFKHVFTMAGTYDYRCDPHAGLGMDGKVVVQAAMNTETVSKSSFVVFPNPSSDNISILATSEKARKVEIYGMDGKLISSTEINSSLSNISISSLSIGVYQLKVVSEGMVEYQEKISKI